MIGVEKCQQFSALKCGKLMAFSGFGKYSHIGLGYLRKKLVYFE